MEKWFIDYSLKGEFVRPVGRFGNHRQRRGRTRRTPWKTSNSRGHPGRTCGYVVERNLQYSLIRKLFWILTCDRSRPPSRSSSPRSPLRRLWRFRRLWRIRPWIQKELRRTSPSPSLPWSILDHLVCPFTLIICCDCYSTWIACWFQLQSRY